MLTIYRTPGDDAGLHALETGRPIGDLPMSIEPVKLYANTPTIVFLAPDDHGAKTRHVFLTGPFQRPEDLTSEDRAVAKALLLHVVEQLEKDE